MAVQPRIITVRRRERLFYIGMAVVILITVFAGLLRPIRSGGVGSQP